MPGRRLFFIMPFGTREVAPDGGTFDFDALYRDVLREVAISSGWDPLRVDEVVAPGSITNQAIQELLRADLVVADVSSANSNVYYELGVRQSISQGGVILIARRGTRLPFDIAHQRVIFYDPDPDGLSVFAAEFQRGLLAWREDSIVSSPVQSALIEIGLATSAEVDPAGFEKELGLKISRARNLDQLIGVWSWAEAKSPLPLSQLIALSAKFAELGDYRNAFGVLSSQDEYINDDFEARRLRGFYLRQLDRYNEAIEEFETALALNPRDPETLGMLGGTYKRLGNFERAISLYERGLALSPKNTYMQVNRAALRLIGDQGEAATGVSFYRQVLAALPQHSEQNSWDALVEAEAQLVVGDLDAALQGVDRAVGLGARRSDLRSLSDQLRLLRNVDFLAESAEFLESRLRERLEAAVSERVDDEGSSPAQLIVHISDPHFGTAVRGGKEIDMHRFFDGENSRKLCEELIEELKRPDLGRFTADQILIVVSGDLTYRASADEFKLVETFLESLCDGLQIDRTQVILVPGNHDVDWALSGIDRSRRFDNFLAFVRSFYKDAFSQRYPLIKWNFDVVAKRPQANEIVSVARIGETTFVGLNSCIFEDDKNHFGFIGQRQLDAVAKLLEGADNSGIKVAVMHHHLHPFPELLQDRSLGDEVWNDTSTIRDAGYVEQRLERLGFDLVLHGHKHKPQLRETLVRHAFEENEGDCKLIVSGAGSVGVNAVELEHNQANHYALIEVLRARREANAEFLRVEWREMAYTPGAEWATTRRWTLNG